MPSSVLINGNQAIHAGNYTTYAMKQMATTNNNIDSDYGVGSITFDPVPTGTPPASSANIRTLNLGENYDRRTQLAFTWDADRAFFRRRNSSGWQSWYEFLHTGNIGNGTLTLAVSGTGLSGSASFTANQSGAATFTVTSNATSANTASTIVARDASGNFSAGTITATLAGLATSETLSTVTGRGASTSTQISVGTSAGGSMFTGTKQGSTYGDQVSGATFKSITDNPNGGSYAFAAYYGGAPGTGTNSFFVGASGDGYFRSNVGIGTTSPGGKLEVQTASGSAATAVILRTSDSASANCAIRWQNSSGTNQAGIGSVFNVSDPGAIEFLNNTTTNMILRSTGNVGIGTNNPGYKLEVNGSFAATTKSFVIKHPTKEGKKLRYGSLEGPENGVYVRGRLKGSNTIDLPDYWEKLVDPDSITVNLTPVGKHQKLYVESVSYKHVVVEKDGLFSGEIDCFYTVFAERIDVEKLQVEIDA